MQLQLHLKIKCWSKTKLKGTVFMVANKTPLLKNYLQNTISNPNYGFLQKKTERCKQLKYEKNYANKKLKEINFKSFFSIEKLFQRKVKSSIKPKTSRNRVKQSSKRKSSTNHYQ